MWLQWYKFGYSLSAHELCPTHVTIRYVVCLYDCWFFFFCIFHWSFYKFIFQDASFHVSILWCSGNKKSKILLQLKKLEQLLLEAIEDDYEDYQIAVNRIECKVGNKVYNYPLLSWCSWNKKPNDFSQKTIYFFAIFNQAKIAVLYS